VAHELCFDTEIPAINGDDHKLSGMLTCICHRLRHTPIPIPEPKLEPGAPDEIEQDFVEGTYLHRIRGINSDDLSKRLEVARAWPQYQRSGHTTLHQGSAKRLLLLLYRGMTSVSCHGAIHTISPRTAAPCTQAKR